MYKEDIRIFSSRSAVNRSGPRSDVDVDVDVEVGCIDDCITLTDVRTDAVCPNSVLYTFPGVDRAIVGNAMASPFISPAIMTSCVVGFPFPLASLSLLLGKG